MTPKINAGCLNKNKREDQEKYTKLSVMGDPACAAYYMTQHCNSDRLWAELIIQNAKVGNPADVAYCMTHYCNSDRLWAEGIKNAS
jgi:hypothetical protein